MRINSYSSPFFFLLNYYLASIFGSVLDMITDRLSTASMLLVLSHYYDELWLVFLGLILLDISSHWFHLHR